MLQRMRKISYITWIWCVCIALNTFLLFSLLSSCVNCFRVKGDSMNPTLENGDRYLGAAPIELRAGDIVVADSDLLDLRIVKRVIAVPGDTIAITNNTVYRNGLPLTEDYIAEPMVTKDMEPFTLDADSYFLLGDNRNNSTDSRRLGPVSREDICYKLIMQPWTVGFLAWVLCLFLTVLADYHLSELETNWIAMLLSRRKQKADRNGKEYTMNYVYLIPHDDGTYEACIQQSAPCESAAMLTAEGEYPVAYCYCRLDINGSAVYEGNTCANREELLECLNCDGEALHTIRHLWDFDSHKAKFHEAWRVFNRATDKVMELLWQIDLD